MYKIQLFGGFRLCDAEDQPIRLGAHSSEALIAYLCLSRGYSADRRSLATELWSENTVSDAKRNLRVALHRVNRNAPGLLMTYGEQLSLCTDNLLLDLQDIENIHRAYLTNSDEEGAKSTLQSYWSSLQRGLLPTWQELWLIEHQEEWHSRFVDASLDLAERLSSSGELNIAYERLSHVLKTPPINVEVAMKTARIACETHNPHIALQIVRSAKAEIQKVGDLIVPRELLDLESQISRPTTGGSFSLLAQESRAESALLIQLFESNIRSGRTESLGLLAEEIYKPLCMKNPEVTLALLRKVNRMEAKFGAEKAELVKAQAHYGAILGDIAAQHDACDLLIQNLDARDTYFIKAISMKGYAFLAERNYEEARVWMQKAFDLESTPAGKLRTGAQFMFLEMDMGHFDEAERVFVPSMAAFVEEGTDNAKRNQTALLEARVYLALLQNDWKAVSDWSESLQSAAKLIGSSKVTISTAFHGLSQLMLHRSKGGVESFARSIQEVHNQGLRWDFDIFVDCAAAAFSKYDKFRTAARLVQAANIHRRRHQHRRTIAEKEFLNSWLGNEAGKYSVAPAENPLAQQTQRVFCNWISEELNQLA